MPITLSTRNQGFEAGFQRLLEAKRESAADVDAAVAAITEDVMRRGDAALIDYTRRFDGVDLTPDILRISSREITEAAAEAPAETVAALRMAAQRIESFHRRQLPAAIDYVDEAGVRLAARWRPIAAAGLYVPGGTAAYPSSVLMNAIPAKVAFVNQFLRRARVDEAIEHAAMVYPKAGSIQALRRGSEADQDRVFVELHHLAVACGVR